MCLALACLALACLALACMGGCGQAKPAEDASGAQQTEAGGGEPTEKPAPPPSGDAGEPDATADEPKAKPKAKPEDRGEPDYDINNSDCQVLAETYGRVWLAGKLEEMQAKKTSKAQAELAEKNFRKAAEQAQANWLQSCQGVVGTPFRRSQLVCASKAKTLQRFDDCWAGKVQ